jgi:hypothetical protein
MGGAAQSFALHCRAAPWKEQEFLSARMLAMVHVLPLRYASCSGPMPGEWRASVRAYCITLSVQAGTSPTGPATPRPVAGTC